MDNNINSENIDSNNIKSGISYLMLLNYIEYNGIILKNWVRI